MTKKQTNYVESEKLEEIVTKAGATIVEQAGFKKVSGASGRNLYIAKTKRVGRVDLSGFTFDGEGVTNLGGNSFGAVKQQLDFSRTETEILESFSQVLALMLSLPPAEKQKRVAPMASKKDAKAKLEEHVPAPQAEDRASRLALIRKVANEKGVAISPKTLAALAPEPDHFESCVEGVISADQE